MTLRERLYYLKAKYRIGFAHTWHRKGFDDGLWASKFLNDASTRESDCREVARYITSLQLAELDTYVPSEVAEAARRILKEEQDDATTPLAGR